MVLLTRSLTNSKTKKLINSKTQKLKLSAFYQQYDAFGQGIVARRVVLLLRLAPRSAAKAW